MKNTTPQKKNATFEKKSFKDFLLKYKGFTIAIVALVIFLLILAFVNYDPAISQEKISYAQELHFTNQSDLNSYVQGIAEELANQQPTTLDETYLISTKDDLIWLAAKENALFSSKPVSDLYPKEIAFTLFMQHIVQINEDYSFDIKNPDYDYEIQKSLTVELTQKEFLSKEEIDAAFTNETEKYVYSQTVNKLFGDYFDSKKQFINTITSKERQFVEAKKLNMLARDTNYY